jgi:hypothetical protein
VQQFVIISPYEYIINPGCSASLVRWRRVLLWRSRYRRQWTWFGFADMPDHLFGWWIPQLEKLTSKSRRTDFQGDGGRFSFSVVMTV